MSNTLRIAFTLTCAASAFAHDGDPKLLDRQPTYVGPGWRNAQLQPQPGGAPTVLQPAVNFQSQNVTLLSWMTIPELIGTTGSVSSCYGYVSPSGREYAIMCCSAGTAFVEVTQPGNPVVVGLITGPNSFWRDTRTYSTYAYSVSEGGSGIQVIDLANIDAGVVTLVAIVNDDATSSTHTVAVDPVAGYLYRSGGGSNGLRIYDVHTNPALPTRVGTWSNIYVHEPSIFSFTTGPAAGKQLAFCCGGLSGGNSQSGLYVVDVTNKASPVQVAFRSYANVRYAHQCWPSPDMQYLYLDDELDDGIAGNSCVTRVFDIADPMNPVFAGTFTNGSTAIDHNQYTRDDRIYQSNYRSGLRIKQTSAPGTPTNPVEIGYFDTYPQDDQASFNGLWNNYPYLPSGIVIGSDIEKGLFVWWVGTPQITIDVPGGVPALLNPAGQGLAVQISGNIVPGTEQLHVDTGAGFVTSNLVALGGGNYQAQFPATVCGSTVSYFLSAQSPNGIVWTSPNGGSGATYESTAAFGFGAVVDESFETTAGGFVAGAAGDTATTGVWTLVDPVGTGAQPEDDHTAGAGVSCWVTGQGAPGGAVGIADVDGGKTTLVSPLIDVSTLASASVSYWRWYDTSEGLQDDTFRVDVSNDGGASWVNVETLGPVGADTLGGWTFHSFLVSNYVTPTNLVQVRFVAEDIASGSLVEAAIDDFQVSSTQCNGVTSFCEGDGTGPTACPCTNDGSTGNGCANSAFASGAHLSASGNSSVFVDTLQLTADSMTGSIAIFFQGGSQLPPAVIDDGIGCVGGPIIRLGARPIPANSSSFPQLGDPLVSVRGAIPPAGGTYYYQCFYRNAVGAFCPPATSNRTNGLVVTWTP